MHIIRNIVRRRLVEDPACQEALVHRAVARKTLLIP